MSTRRRPKKKVRGFPSQLGSLTAEILVRLLMFKHLTSMSAVSDASTTRLAAKIFNLRHLYGWEIEFKDKFIATKDGRVSKVREYFLNAEDIAKAKVAGADAWMRQVLVARAARRAHAGKLAQAINAWNAAHLQAERQTRPEDEDDDDGLFV